MAAARSDPLRKLAAGVLEITGRPLASSARDQFARYLDLLLEWNRVHRLTGFSSPGEVVDKLFLDSVLFLSVLPPRPLRVADIGTGPGIPGVPLRILDPRISLTLIESKRRAISFLSMLKRELALDDVRILHARAEGAVGEPGDLEGKFDVVVSRAVARRPAVLRSVRQLLRPGGTFIASGPPEGPVPVPPTAAAGFSVAPKRVDFPHLRFSRQFLIAVRET